MGLGHTFEVNGTLTQGPDSLSSDQYDYSYNVDLKSLLTQTKLIYAYNDTLYPYLLLGLGTTFNKASNFKTTVPAITSVTKNYSANTAHSLTYQLGLGIDKQILPSTRLGISYRYVNFGQVNLGSPSFGSGTLSQSNLDTHEVLLQLTYAI